MASNGHSSKISNNEDAALYNLRSGKPSSHAQHHQPSNSTVAANPPQQAGTSERTMGEGIRKNVLLRKQKVG